MNNNKVAKLKAKEKLSRRKASISSSWSPKNPPPSASHPTPTMEHNYHTKSPTATVAVADHSPRRHRRRTSLFASCLIATAFLLFTAAALVAVFFTVFRPHDPAILVNAVQLPRYSSANGTARFTFSQYAAVRNPNRAALSHYDSSVQLVYAGRQVGFMFIPAGEIDAGRTQYMATSLEVGSVPTVAPVPVMEMESRMKVRGRVRVLRFLTHHVETTVGCRVGVSAADGSVLGYRC